MTSGDRRPPADRKPGDRDASPPSAPGVPGTFAGSTEVAAAVRLAELEKAHREGLLTDDEYLRKREEILASL